jgi:hypothetical protein
MGKAITYCVQCSKRVSDSEFETGKAFRVGDRILCRACAPESVKNQTSKKITRPANAVTSSALKTQKASIPTPAPSPTPAAEKPDRKKLFLIAGGAAAGVVLLVLVLVLALRKGEPGPVAKPPVDPTPPSAPISPIDSKEASGKADLEKARAYAQSHPDDLPGRLKQFTDITWNWEGTDAAAEAKKEAAAVKEAILAKVQVWMTEAEVQFQELLDKKDYYAAAKKLESLKPTHDLPEWRLAAEKRASDLYGEARKLKDLAEAAKEKDLEEKPRLPETPPSKDKPLSDEAKGYQAKWEAAVARATARDFGAAVSEIERAMGTLKEADVKAEATQDAEDLKRVAALRTAALDTLKKKTRGTGISLAVRQASGEVKRLGGMILQIDAQRVELQVAKGSTFVEWDDVAAPALAEAGEASKADSRTLAQVCLLEGDVEAAKAYKATLAPRWWSYAEGARAKLPPPDATDKAVRELYYAAEKGFRSMETRPAAVEGYKTLKSDYGSTSLVKSYAERIAKRAETGKEYYFAPVDFHVEGTIRLAKNGKLESVKDTDEPDTLYNLAEIEFAALPGLGYRCWVWVGACCEETFLFYIQGSEITDTDPKTKKKIACEPGTNFAMPVKLSLRNLKKTHLEHKPKGASTHPKTAARWEWIEIPMPKFSTPGAKKVRIMTHHAGFSIGGAVVSSTRKAAPAEPELKDLEKDREVKEASPVDPDLVAWWGFEEGGGNQVVDLTGKGHDAKVSGPVQWAEGKIGGGMRFLGPGPALTAADAEDLRLPGDMTLAFWMKKEGETGDWSCLVGKGEKGERNYGLWLEKDTRILMFQQYGGANVNLRSRAGVADGTWIHVAATVEGAKATLYINGVKDGEAARNGAAVTPAVPVGLGWACDHGSFKGILDDIRIYRRGLTADEVRALAEQAR